MVADEPTEKVKARYTLPERLVVKPLKGNPDLVALRDKLRKENDSESDTN